MASSFGWVDFSEEERKKMVNLIHLFDEQDTRDELGIGSVRDAFSNLLFPGTSTIQTRAKYMLFIPWAYQKLESKAIPSVDIGKKARVEEITLIQALMNSEDTGGVIGKEAGAKLQRLPSMIYWTGLGSWGIRRYPGSQEQYHRQLDSYYSSKKKQVFGDDKEPVSGMIEANWDRGLPSPPANFPKTASSGLTKVEAEYLQDRILTHCRGSMLAFLVSQTLPNNEILTCDFIWEHPSFKDFPVKLQEFAIHARNFSETMHGAALLYNLMLANKLDNAERIEHYTDLLQDWTSRMESRSVDLKKWDRQAFWKIVEQGNLSIALSTRRFINGWLNLLLVEPKMFKPIENAQARSLIMDREFNIKHKRARLTNQRALEQWSGAAGTAQLDYRWHVVQVIINDILMGLTGGTANA